jgi:4-amino-4-deoxy-L-arabinose transferase-like glycosyltransferase
MTLGYVPAVSAPEHVNPSAHSARHIYAAQASAPAEQLSARASAISLARITRLSVYAWGAIAATLTFIVLTCWWLTQDRSIPIYDAGGHLETAFIFHQMLAGGNLLGPFNYESPYPPLAPMIGALAVFVGGVHVAPPIIAENVVFVSLLTLGCYQTGRLLFGPKAGMLASILILGSDLLTAQLHVFMIDAPEAAVVSVSIWLLLACEDFSRLRWAGFAGLAVGLGLITKVQYPSFVMGIVLMALLRGGWRNWRGLVAFAVPAVIVGIPWYVDHLTEFSTFLQVSTNNPIVIPGDVPPTLSINAFTWYFWNMLNSQLLVPLFALLVGGTIWMFAMLFRHRREALGRWWGHSTPSDGEQSHNRSPASAGERIYVARLEFFFGAFVAWLFITVTPSHDIRYGIPLLPYLAVIATGWIVYLPRVAARLAIALLAVGVIANTFGTTFGTGSTLQLKLVKPLPAGEELPGAITFYSTGGFLVAGPKRDGNVPGLLVALKREGVKTVAWSLEQSREPDFDAEGLQPLIRVAGLSGALTYQPQFSNSSSVVTLVHLPITATTPPPCTRLSDGTGVWVVRYSSSSRKDELYCPTRYPQFYGTSL